MLLLLDRPHLLAHHLFGMGNLPSSHPPLQGSEASDIETRSFSLQSDGERLVVVPAATPAVTSVAHLKGDPFRRWLVEAQAGIALAKLLQRLGSIPPRGERACRSSVSPRPSHWICKPANGSAPRSCEPRCTSAPAARHGQVAARIRSSHWLHR